MRNLEGCRQTRVLGTDAAGIAEAATILARGGLVALPTETVYGLGAHALDGQAVRAIFAAKGRPADDPLIVHIADPADLTTVARPDDRAWRLAERFWPGPLTLVLPKEPIVPSEVTAGLPNVAVRVPAHAVAQALLRASELPIAAPSANLFGRPSPTRAEHVLADLDGRIDAVLDGGPTVVGVESTIVSLTDNVPRILRPGGVPAEDIEAILGQSLATASAAVAGPQAAPGMLASHYAPRTPLTLIVGDQGEARRRLLSEIETALGQGLRVGVVAVEEDLAQVPDNVVVETVGAYGDAAVLARTLFSALRALDTRQLDLLLARQIADPERGLGRALADRLQRAAERIIRVPAH